MQFDNKYLDFENRESELTESELQWFYSIVNKFYNLPEASGIEIVNRNHEELSRKNREAYGIFWTIDPNDTKSESFITIDNFLSMKCMMSFSMELLMLLLKHWKDVLHMRLHIDINFVIVKHILILQMKF